MIKPRPFNYEQKFAEIFFSQFIEPLFFKGFLKNEHVLLHAAGLESDGKGILIYGPQNIGKTSLTINLAKRGWKVHGDDMCILSKNGFIYSHAKPLKLENEFLMKSGEKFKRLWKSSPSVDKSLLTMINHKLGRIGRFEFKVPFSSLGIEISKKSKISAVFFLQRCFNPDSSNTIDIEKISPARALSITKQHIATEFDVNKRIDRDIRYTYALYNKCETNLSVVNQQVSSILESSLATIPSYLVTISQPDSNVANSIEDLVKTM